MYSHYRAVRCERQAREASEFQIFLLSSPEKRIGPAAAMEFQITLAIAVRISHATIQAGGRARTAPIDRVPSQLRAQGASRARMGISVTPHSLKLAGGTPHHAELFIPPLGFLALVPGFHGPLAA